MKQELTEKDREMALMGAILMQRDGWRLIAVACAFAGIETIYFMQRCGWHRGACMPAEAGCDIIAVVVFLIGCWKMFLSLIVIRHTK